MPLTFGNLKRNPFSVRTTTLAAAACTALLLTAAPADAVTKCKGVTSSSDGTIEVTAANVTGQLLWGPGPGLETSSFANEATCIGNGKAKKCTLGAEGSPERITPPRHCSIFLADQAGTCVAYLKGCTPGLRDEIATGDGSSGSGGSGDPDTGVAVQLVDGVEVPYTRTPVRYVVVATHDPSYPNYDTASRVVALPHDVLLDYCADEDGCSMTMSMRNWNASGSAAMSVGPLRFHYNAASGAFRTAETSLSGEFGAFGEGTDDDGVFNHALRVANCWLTDADYDVGTNDSYDTEMGLHLLNHNTSLAYTGDCELTLDD